MSFKTVRILPREEITPHSEPLLHSQLLLSKYFDDLLTITHYMTPINTSTIHIDHNY